MARQKSMILNYHPADARNMQYAETTINPNPKFIGYWFRNQDDDLPDPAHFVEASWNHAERREVVEYLRKG